MMSRPMPPGKMTVETPGYEIDGIRCPEVRLQGDGVREFADLLSMKTDLAHVIAVCSVHSNLFNADELDHDDQVVAIRAVWEAAIIAYARAFVTGASAARRGDGKSGRTRFPGDVLARLTTEQRAVHDHTLHLRNRHVGHRVNDWQQVHITAVLSPEVGGPRRFMHLGEKVFMLVGGGNEAEKLKEVATILRDGLDERLAELRSTLEAELRARPIDSLYEAVVD